jgi:hypothetical protein
MFGPMNPQRIATPPENYLNEFAPKLRYFCRKLSSAQVKYFVDSLQTIRAPKKKNFPGCKKPREHFYLQCLGAQARGIRTRVLYAPPALDGTNLPSIYLNLPLGENVIASSSVDILRHRGEIHHGHKSPKRTDTQT